MVSGLCTNYRTSRSLGKVIYNRSQLRTLLYSCRRAIRERLVVLVASLVPSYFDASTASNSVITPDFGGFPRFSDMGLTIWHLRL